MYAYSPSCWKVDRKIMSSKPDCTTEGQFVSKNKNQTVGGEQGKTSARLPRYLFLEKAVYF